MYRVSIFVETDSKCMRSTDKCCGYVLSCKSKIGKETTAHSFERITGTWNQATLAPMIDAVKRINQICEIAIHSDNEFVLEMIDKNLELWRKNGYKTARGTDVANKEQWQQLGKLLKNHRVQVEKGVHEYSEWMKRQW